MMTCSTWRASDRKASPLIVLVVRRCKMPRRRRLRLNKQWLETSPIKASRMELSSWRLRWRPRQRLTRTRRPTGRLWRRPSGWAEQRLWRHSCGRGRGRWRAWRSSAGASLLSSFPRQGSRWLLWITRTDRGTLALLRIWCGQPWVLELMQCCACHPLISRRCIVLWRSVQKVSSCREWLQRPRLRTSPHWSEMQACELGVRIS
mmetsp:Transcript_44971/g.119032  ORF Transcript_44971/g.119032 Transcript_44971/m.119032 type:complete len:204 (+) Transcript_44971:117-728(+)